MELERVINIPEGINIDLEKRVVSVSGPKGQIKREVRHSGIEIKKKDSTIIVQTDKPRRKNLAMVGTVAAHIQNMIRGVTASFEYRMKIVYAHFPIQVKVEGTDVSVSNFLGEKKSRKARITGDTKVKVSGDQLIITGINKEDVGQTAANIEQATRIRGFDPRVFQDGIYIVEKGGR